MRTSRKSLGMAALGAATLAMGLASVPAPALAATNTVDMYRLYNKYTGEHLYTASAQERDFLAKKGWSKEGVGWVAPKTSKTPVYRLYNPFSGDHHYTTDKNEYETLGKRGWNKEGTGWYSDDAKGTPLYRQFNPYEKVGTHNYTANKGENDALVKAGWKAEGIAWYGVKVSGSQQKPSTGGTNTSKPNTGSGGTSANKPNTGNGGSTLPASKQKALAAAQKLANGFQGSKKALIYDLKKQGHSETDATWAADQVKVNWNENATKYLERGLDSDNWGKVYSRAEMKENLMRFQRENAGLPGPDVYLSGFTKSEAEYAMKHASKLDEVDWNSTAKFKAFVYVENVLGFNNSYGKPETYDKVYAYLISQEFTPSEAKYGATHYVPTNG